MSKATEIREMSDDQITLTLKEAADNLFRLRIKAQTDRLDTPSELKKHRRLIARIKTIQAERAPKEVAAPKPVVFVAPAKVAKPKSDKASPTAVKPVASTKSAAPKSEGKPAKSPATKK